MEVTDMGVVTVRDALLTDGLIGSQVIAGEKGLEREVRTVIIGEIPDIKNWLRGGDFVATTACFMHDQPVMEEWVRGLIKNGAAALAIKPKRFIPAIPETLINLGNELAFPIIELPEQAGQSEITEGILRLILVRQSEILKRSQASLASLMELVLKGYGLDTIANALADLVNNPILIESSDYKLLGCSTTSAKSQELVIMRRGEGFLRMLKEHQDLIKAIKSKVKCIVRLPVIAASSRCTQITIPILISGELYGFLSILELKNTLNEWDYATLEQAYMVIALELCKQDASFAAEEKARGEFLSCLLDDERFSKQAVEKSADILGFNYKKPLVAMVVRTRIESNPSSHLISSSGIDKNLAKMVISLLNPNDPNVFVVSRYDDIVIFYHPQDISSEVKVEEVIQRVSKQLSETVRSVPGCARTIIGIGRMSSDVQTLKHSYKEAMEAISIAENFCSNEEIINYRHLGYYRLLTSEIADHQRALLFCNDIIGKLIEYDKEHQSDLLTTLEIYLNTNGNHAKVARQMFLHVNSVQYRLKKIEKILDKDLDNMELRLNLWLALKIWNYLFSLKK
jgi:purine catabolism regulator